MSLIKIFNSYEETRCPTHLSSILKEGDTECVDSYGRCALFYFEDCFDVKIIKLLATNKAVNTKDIFGNYPIDFFYECDNPEIIKLIKPDNYKPSDKTQQLYELNCGDDVLEIILG